MSRPEHRPRRRSPETTFAIPGLACELAESPVWDDQRQAVFWVDIGAGVVHSVDIENGRHRSWNMAEPVSCIALTDGEHILVAGTSGIWALWPETSHRSLCCAIDDFGGMMRPNDGKVGPDGALWIGTMENRDDRGPSGKLYRIGQNFVPKVVINGLVTPNGMEWSPDGRRMYLAETRELVVKAWDFDAAIGEISNRRDYIRFGPGQGKPDGAMLDADGVYWVCGIYSGCLWGFDHDGLLVGEISLGHPMITMPCLAGSQLDQLFVTSLSRSGSVQGGLLRAGPCGLVGRKPHRFRLG